MPKRSTDSTLNKALSNITEESSKKIGKILQKDEKFQGGNIIQELTNTTKNMYKQTFGGASTKQLDEENVKKMEHILNIKGGSLASAHIMDLFNKTKGGDIEAYEQLYNKSKFKTLNGGKKQRAGSKMMNQTWPHLLSIKEMPGELAHTQPYQEVDTNLFPVDKMTNTVPIGDNYGRISYKLGGKRK